MIPVWVPLGAIVIVLTTNIVGIPLIIHAQRRKRKISQDKPTLRYVWHGTNDSREGSTGRVYTDPLMQKAYDEGFEHGASQDKPTRAGAPK